MYEHGLRDDAGERGLKLMPRHKSWEFWAAFPLIVFVLLPFALALGAAQAVAQFAARWLNTADRLFVRYYEHLDKFALRAERSKDA